MSSPVVPDDATVPVRAVVLGALAGSGRAPTPEEIAVSTGRSGPEVRNALRVLAERHALVLDADDGIRMAHPFAAAPMGFVVFPRDRFDERRWWGGCAWDSFGISAALDLDVVVITTCRFCHRHLRVACGPDTAPPAELVVRVPCPADKWWDDVVATCSAIRLFCSHEHAQRWVDADPARAGGQLVPGTTMWRLAQPWYGDRLADGFAPHTREHNQRLLDEVGLTGGFWRLP